MNWSPGKVGLILLHIGLGVGANLALTGLALWQRVGIFVVLALIVVRLLYCSHRDTTTRAGED